MSLTTRSTAFGNQIVAILSQSLLIHCNRRYGIF